jgi:hypothetical protein
MAFSFLRSSVSGGAALLASRPRVHHPAPPLLRALDLDGPAALAAAACLYC